MKLSREKRAEYEEDRKWCVFTAHQLTSEAISQYMETNGNGEPITGRIHYAGEKPVYFVPFFVAEYLVTANKSENKFEFEIYYKKCGKTTWVRWMEEKKTPNQKKYLFVRGGHIRKAI